MPSSQRGIVLVIVLWIVALLSVMAASFAYSMRTETTLAAHAVGRAQARALAEAGVNYALLHLLDPSEAAEWPADGTVRDWQLGSERVRIRVTSASGLVDLNQGQRELLRGLLAAGGVAQEELDSILDAIEDWRDPDDLARVNGAESREYADAGRPFGPKNAPFESVEELQQVLGITAARYRRLAPWVTVHSRQPGVDPATAPAEVLKAVPGTDPNAIDHFIALRVDHRAQGLPPPPPPTVPGLYLSGGQGLTYHVAVEAYTESGSAAFVEATLVARGARPDRPFQVLAWREGKR